VDFSEPDELPEKRNNKTTPAPQPTPIYKLSITSMIWSISIGQLGLAAWLCLLPALVHLLISPAWQTGKSP